MTASIGWQMYDNDILNFITLDEMTAILWQFFGKKGWTLLGGGNFGMYFPNKCQDILWWRRQNRVAFFSKKGRHIVTADKTSIEIFHGVCNYTY